MWTLGVFLKLSDVSSKLWFCWPTITHTHITRTWLVSYVRSRTCDYSHPCVSKRLCHVNVSFCQCICLFVDRWLAESLGCIEPIKAIRAQRLHLQLCVCAFSSGLKLRIITPFRNEVYSIMLMGEPLWSMVENQFSILPLNLVQTLMVSIRWSLLILEIPWVFTELHHQHQHQQ